MDNPREKLAAIQAVADAATPGPWSWLSPNQCCSDYCIESDHLGGYPVAHNVDCARADAVFIAAARSDIPRLVAALTAVLDLCDDVSRHAPDALDLADDIEQAVTAALGSA